jgi:SagB-type dehydrogenase family enzyme
MMNKISLIFGAILFMLVLTQCTPPPPVTLNSTSAEHTAGKITLPPPNQTSDTSLEQALVGRRSVRTYRSDPLSLAEVSQLLWATQGITSPDGKRTAPSAGALYPLEIYIMVGNMDGLNPGIYHFMPQTHELVLVLEGDRRNELSEAALDQSSVRDAPVVFIITAIFERTTKKYGDRGIHYVHMEVGSAAQNIYLQAVSLELGTVFIGAFYENDVKQLTQIDDEAVPLGLMPVGKK